MPCITYSNRCLLSQGILALALVIICLPDISAKQHAQSKSRLYQLNPVVEHVVAPDFTLPDRKGFNHRLSDYKGQVVIINFWSTWCIPCRQEMPALERAWQRLQPSNAVFLSIAMQDELESIELFLKDTPVSFPVLLDSKGEIAGQWRVIGIPVTFILDSSGWIAYRETGIREWDNDSIINKILDLTPVSGRGEN